MNNRSCAQRVWPRTRRACSLGIRALVGLWLTFAALYSAAAEPVVLVVDERGYQLEPLLGATWMEPMPGPGERASWRPADGQRSFNATPVIIGGIPTVMSSNELVVLRQREILPILDAYGTPQEARARLDPLIDEALGAHRLEVAGRYRARYVNHEIVASTPPRPEGQRAFALQLDGFPIVGLSWDNRRVLVSFSLKTYQRSRGKRTIERERSARVFRYASAPAPMSSDPIAHWSENGAVRTHAEVASAFREGLALALAETWPDRDARPGRKETATLEIDGRSVVYRGRLLGRDARSATLLHHDGSVTLLRLAP